MACDWGNVIKKQPGRIKAPSDRARWVLLKVYTLIGGEIAIDRGLGMDCACQQSKSYKRKSEVSWFFIALFSAGAVRKV